MDKSTRDPKPGDVYRRGNGPEVYTHWRIKTYNPTTGLIRLQHMSVKYKLNGDSITCWRGGCWISIETLRRDFNFVRE